MLLASFYKQGNRPRVAKEWSHSFGKLNTEPRQHGPSHTLHAAEPTSSLALTLALETIQGQL